MTPEQKQAARERMLKAQAVRMANIQARKQAAVHGGLAQNTPQSPVAVLERPAAQDGMDIVLGFKVTRDGAFHGLWQLYRQVGGEWKPVGAETSKLSVLNLARQEVASYLP